MIKVISAHYTDNRGVNSRSVLFCVNTENTDKLSLLLRASEAYLNNGKNRLKMLRSSIPVSEDLECYLIKLSGKGKDFKVVADDFKAGVNSEVDSNNVWRYMVRIK